MTIKENQHQPDTQECTSTALDGSLPDKGYSTGYSADKSLGDCDADCLREGFHNVGIAGHMSDQREGDEVSFPGLQTPGGFLGRAAGWDR